MPIRKNLQESRDPYRPWGGQKALSFCRECGAVYGNKSWSLNPSFIPPKDRPVRGVICPACRKIRDGFPSGVITLEGGFLKAHKVEILNCVRNEEKRAGKFNPQERIIRIDDRGERVEIQTTSERFAQRIGREIARAFKGRTTYQWGSEDKFVRVAWHRGEAHEAEK